MSTPNTTVTPNDDGTWTTCTNAVERHTFRTEHAARSFADARARVGCDIIGPCAVCGAPAIDEVRNLREEGPWVPVCGVHLNDCGDAL